MKRGAEMSTTKQAAVEPEADPASELMVAVARLRDLLTMSTEEATNWTTVPSEHDTSKIFSLDYAMRHVIDDIWAQATALDAKR